MNTKINNQIGGENGQKMQVEMEMQLHSQWDDGELELHQGTPFIFHRPDWQGSVTKSDDTLFHQRLVGKHTFNHSGWELKLVEPNREEGNRVCNEQRLKTTYNPSIENWLTTRWWLHTMEYSAPWESVMIRKRLQDTLLNGKK